MYLEGRSGIGGAYSTAGLAQQLLYGVVTSLQGTTWLHGLLLRLAIQDSMSTVL